MTSLLHAPYAFAFYLLPEVFKSAKGLQEVFGQVLGEAFMSLSCPHQGLLAAGGSSRAVHAVQLLCCFPGS